MHGLIVESEAHRGEPRGTCEIGLIVDNFAGGGGASTGIEQAFAAMFRDGEIESPRAVDIEGEEYVIVDIGMRMLSPRELFNAQGFPPDYIIDRDAEGRPITKTAQVAKCGNSVCPPIAEALVRANCAAYRAAEAPEVAAA